MRVLLDENVPHDLISELVGHTLLTVQGLGWAGAENGDLLQRAAGQADAFLTMDRKLESQHDLSRLSFGVIVIRARCNRMPDLLPLVSDILGALSRIRPGKVERVGA